MEWQTNYSAAGWVKEASTAKIMQDPIAPQSKKDSSDWLQGYCYQMWRCRHNAFRGDGAFGQYMIVMPDEDAALGHYCRNSRHAGRNQPGVAIPVAGI